MEFDPNEFQFSKDSVAFQRGQPEQDFIANYVSVAILERRSGREDLFYQNGSLVNVITSDFRKEPPTAERRARRKVAKRDIYILLYFRLMR
jgi:hypothetical protein